MSEKDLRAISDKCFPCSDGVCRNLDKGRLFMYSYLLTGGFTSSEIERFLTNSNVNVNKSCRCQPGKAWCVSLPQ